MFVVTGPFKSNAERDARQNELIANPPPPGSMLVVNETEKWSVLAPELSSFEAGEDGLSLKKMIAIGAGVPTHYLAEPESSTRTTAEAAGTPTFRGLEQTQTSFMRFLTRLVKIAVRIRRAAAPHEHLNPDSVEVIGPDITERDNAVLALAVARIYPTLTDLFDRDGIDEAELLRLVYRMAGEAYDEDATVPKDEEKAAIVPRAAPSSQPAKPSSPASPGDKPPSDPASRPAPTPRRAGDK